MEWHVVMTAKACLLVQHITQIMKPAAMGINIQNIMGGNVVLPVISPTQKSVVPERLIVIAKVTTVVGQNTTN